MSPQISRNDWPCDTDITELEFELAVRNENPVDNNSSNVTVFQWTSINLRSLKDQILSSAVDLASSLFAKFVLIDCYEFFIDNYGKACIRYLFQVASQNQWGLSHSPQSEVRLFLFLGQAVVAYLKHVWVIPGTRPGNLWVFGVQSVVQFE